MREIFARGSFAGSLYKFFFPAAHTKVIAISAAVRDALPVSMRGRATVIYNGVALPPRIDRRKIEYPVKFLYLGRIVPWKGCDFIIEAFRRLLLLTSPVSATLNLTGATIYWDPAYRRQLQYAIAGDGLEKTVTICDASEKPLETLQDHHVLCMASRNEPFGRVAVEAMGCGMPVVGFTSGGMPEVVANGETGILVKDGDEEAFTKALQSFVTDPQRIITMGRAGRERAENQFNRDTQVPLIADAILQRKQT